MKRTVENLIKSTPLPLYLRQVNALPAVQSCQNMALRERDFFSTLSEIGGNLQLLEECNAQLKKYDLLTPKHAVIETVRHFTSILSSISLQILGLKPYVDAASDENKPKLITHCRLLEERLESIKSTQQSIVDTLKKDEARFHEERNRQAKEDPVCRRSLQTQLVSGISSSIHRCKADAGPLRLRWKTFTPTFRFRQTLSRRSNQI